MNEVSNIASEASKPSAGASWQRPAIGRPTSASISNCAKFCSSAQLQISLVNIILRKPVEILLIENKIFCPFHCLEGCSYINYSELRNYRWFLLLTIFIYFLNFLCRLLQFASSDQMVSKW